MHVPEQTYEYNYCALPLAAYACRPDQTQGRLNDEPESAVRTAFQRDRDRIIHSLAFRRLKHKTQVFVAHEGDDYRTRLTHTLEVAQIARTLARALLVNEDLAEAVALAHDMGHPPFAHSGEDALKECMAPYGGFEHNDQSLRTVTLLEEKYPHWDGLNLTWETLEGIVKHNGPVAAKQLPATLNWFSKKLDLRLDTYASVEAQIAAISDDIAYNNHDVEDGLRENLFTMDDLSQIALLKEVIDTQKQKYPNLAYPRFVHAVVRDMIGRMVTDVLQNTKANLDALKPQSVEDVRRAGRQVVDFSPAMMAQVKELRAFLRTRMYRHSSVNRVNMRAARLVNEVFTHLMAHPYCMPEAWQQKLPATEDETAKARVVVDYIAGMTDRMAVMEHRRLLGLYEDLK